MALNKERFQEDIKNLFKQGALIQTSIQSTPTMLCFSYQEWYTESLSVISSILPSRLRDFCALYEDGDKKLIRYFLANPTSSVFAQVVSPLFVQQLTILKSAQRVFESSLFEIRQSLMADMFDSELDSAKELLSNGFVRAAGVVAGVVLEKHLAEVCSTHNLTIEKSNPTINDYNNELYTKKVIDLAKQRKIQLLADYRNNCAHAKKAAADKEVVEPKSEDVSDMIDGVNNIIRTVS